MAMVTYFCYYRSGEFCQGNRGATRMLSVVTMYYDAYGVAWGNVILYFCCALYCENANIQVCALETARTTAH